MVARVNLLRNVGQFDNVSAGQLPFSKLTLFYGENGRGKTTIAAILRSLSTGDPSGVTDRKRLGAPADPHVIVDLGAGVSTIFQSGKWSRKETRLVIFDDEFIEKNVCQGIAVDAAQRQNLHELILGAQGVGLASIMQGHINDIEKHTREIKVCGAAIPEIIRGRFTVDAFCGLKPVPNVDAAIAAVEARLAAARSVADIIAAPVFPTISLPSFDLGQLEVILGRELRDLDAAAAAGVQEHVRKLGAGGEKWLNEGAAFADKLSGQGDKSCPFCEQDLSGSGIIAHYRAYFGSAYAALKKDIADEISANQRVHAGDVPAAFERLVKEAIERREFWQRFTNIGKLELDTAAVVRSWKTTRDAVDSLLWLKQAAPLEPLTATPDLHAVLQAYRDECAKVEAFSKVIGEANNAVAQVKAEAGVADVATLERELGDLRAAKARFEPENNKACLEYTSEVNAKKSAESARDLARAALENYRKNVFPQYRASVNDFLRRFNAGYHIGGLEAVNHRGGSSANYNFVVNGNDVGLGSFKTTLSAGDRNTLALAFFFATLEHDPTLATKIVVIDDPMTSLDEHRSLHTVQEIHRLTDRVEKVIVLSHSKTFLFDIWTKCGTVPKAALEVRRAGQGSNLLPWNVTNDMVSAIDKLYGKTTEYLTNGGTPAEAREVATGLRPILERFVRIAFPSHWRPDMMLGQFHGLAVQKLGTADEILGPQDTIELRALLDYANRFHHDTNMAWQTEIISDAELADFSRRTLAFATRPTQ